MDNYAKMLQMGALNLEINLLKLIWITSMITIFIGEVKNGDPEPTTAKELRPEYIHPDGLLTFDPYLSDIKPQEEEEEDDYIPLPENDETIDGLPIFLLEPKNSYVIRNKPATILCRAANALQVFFKCNDVRTDKTVQYEHVDPQNGVRVVEAELNVTRNELDEYFGGKYGCECYAWNSKGRIRSQSIFIEYAFANMKHFERLSVLFIPIVWSMGVQADDYYSSYYGGLLNSDDVAEYMSNGTLANCTNVVSPCDSTEGRRIDGTCNNLNYPSKGATRTPYLRILEAIYNHPSDTVFDPKLSEDGEELTGARIVRTRLVADGRVEDDMFTHCATHFAVFFATDITNTRDTTNYVSWRPFCCEEAGASDPMCAPNLVPADDYVHRYSGIRCLNMTRPLTFQTSGCLPMTTTPLRIVDATPLWDLSPVYGNTVEPGRRSNVNGTLAIETVNGVDFPPASGVNLLLGVNFFGIIFFWRFHNHIARKLLEVNQHWTDEQLFNTAREINIASGSQIFYYELMALLMGPENLIEDNVIQNKSGYREMYDETLTPSIYLEFPVVLRWMHKMQDGVLKFYDSEGEFLNKTYPMVNLTSNINYIKEGENMAQITQSCFRQPSGKLDDHIADPDIINLGLGGLQRSNDIMTNDLAKNRHSGFQSYIKYRAYCFGDNIASFDDLKGIIEKERIEALKDVYANVADIDLLAGVWVEIFKEGSHVPPTFYCIVKDQLLHNIKSDRHWYEREKRPNAFTEAQLAEIRKVTGARILCDIGDSVTAIQPSVFKLPGEGNKIVDCSEIPDIDYTAWSDN